ncbi:MAG: hypothetical protein IBX43_03625 [Campylobacterales bacterium]|nr:hypothetical protein [Campylobacterales bacterium]
MCGINLSKQERKKISLQQLAEMNASETSFYQEPDLNVSVHQKMRAPFLSHCHALLEGQSEAHCLKRMYRARSLGRRRRACRARVERFLKAIKTS